MSSLPQRLQRCLHRVSIPHLTAILVTGQAACFVLAQFRPGLLQDLSLQPDRILAGEVWRLATFAFIPPRTHPIFILFALYVFFLMGTALERGGGESKYTLYYLVGYLATLASGFLMTGAETTNTYLMTSVFLAFAYLFPNFQFYIFFILPVKVKWLALLTWAGYAILFLSGDAAIKLMITAACANFLLFFSRPIWRRIKSGRRRMEFQAKTAAGRRPGTPFHQCTVCRRTELSDPALDFRVCPACTEGKEYCREHLADHSHT